MEHTTPSRSRWSDLIGGILLDVKSLLQQEVQLFKDEVKLEISTAGRAATKFLIGAALGILGLLFLLLMLVHGLHEWTVLPLWACYGLVGGHWSGLVSHFLYGRSPSQDVYKPHRVGRYIA